MDDRETKPFASDAERTRKAEVFEQLAARIDAATDAIEMLRIADAIQAAFGSAGLVGAEAATYRLRRLLVERLDRRMQGTLSPPDPELSDPRVAAAGERCFWDEVACRYAAAIGASSSSSSTRISIAKDSAAVADALLAERRARRASSSAP